jgi:hypothetical protein
MDGGGGDAIKIIAQNFENPTRLEDAYRSIDAKLTSSLLLSEYQFEIKQELRKLIDENKFKELPELIILGGNSEVNTYTLSKTEGEFISLGGMTNFQSADPVYLAKRVENYDLIKTVQFIQPYFS